MASYSGNESIKAAEQQVVQKRKVGVDAYRHEQAVQVTQHKPLMGATRNF
jgi:hypothetical protein